MSSETTIGGRIVRRETGPVSGASVRLYAGGERVDTVESGPIGSFTVDAGDADGPYRIEVVRDGAELTSESVPAEAVGTELDPFVLDPPSESDDGASGEAGVASSDGGASAESALPMVMTDYGDGSSMPFHGTLVQRGMVSASKTVPLSANIDNPAGSRGRFDYMFPNLKTATHDVEFLRRLGEQGGPMDIGNRELPETDGLPPAGYVFFGQFVDHDITLDPISSLDKRNDPSGLRNFRTPRLDLDSMYLSGPEVSRYLFARANPQGGYGGQTDPEKFLLRQTNAGLTDLQRNEQGTAIIGDPRNDENQILSQMMRTMLGVHNKIVDQLPSGEGFEKAQELTRWTYQWLVINDFLPRICGNPVVQDIKRNGRQFYMANANTDARPYMPVEFAGAAYRYGHSQIEEQYRVNDSYMGDLFQGSSGNTLRGFRPVPGNEAIDWSYFFDVDGLEYVPRPELPPIRPPDPPQIPDPIQIPDTVPGFGGSGSDGSGDGSDGSGGSGGSSGGAMPDGGSGGGSGGGTVQSSGGVFGPDVQKVAPIDTKLPESLMQLPFITGNEPKSLASRNLIRGRQIKLPSGQAVARKMGVQVLSSARLGFDKDATQIENQYNVSRGDSETPLWYYVLAEAEELNDGEELGPVGARIVAEVLFGLVDLDPTSYMNVQSGWTPSTPSELPDPPFNKNLTVGGLLDWAE